MPAAGTLRRRLLQLGKYMYKYSQSVHLYDVRHGDDGERVTQWVPCLVRRKYS